MQDQANFCHRVSHLLILQRKTIAHVGIKRFYRSYVQRASTFPVKGNSLPEDIPAVKVIVLWQNAETYIACT